MSGYPRQTCLVLLVEDEAIIAVSVQDELEGAGYAVAGPFATCVAALHWLATQTPDLAVLDIHLQDGPCRDIAAELTRRAVPFLVYSGLRQDRNTLREFMNCEWVEKPVSPDVLLTALSELRAGPRLRHG